MILTRCFGGLRMHGVVTPAAEQLRVRALAGDEDALAAIGTPRAGDTQASEATEALRSRDDDDRLAA